MTSGLTNVKLGKPGTELCDEKHSDSEERLYCVGRVGKKIVTVRFTQRGKRIRIIAPEQLLPSEEAIKITLAVDSKTLKIFKNYADKAG